MATEEEPLLCIIDTDPGVDDTMALLLALAQPNVKVLGLTIVHGNLPSVKDLGRNACRVLDLAGRNDVPVYLGAAKPLMLPAHGGAAFVHGSDGLGGFLDNDEQPSTQPQSDKSAAQFIVDTCRSHPGRVTLIALGPLTNIATACLLDADLCTLVQRVSLMGGAVAHPGNITALAEANVYNDPHAAHLVFNQAWDVLMCPLNVTWTVFLSRDDVEAIGELGSVGKFVRDMAQFYLTFFKEHVGLDGMRVHDSCAVLAVTHPEVFTHKIESHIDVECQSVITRGVTVGDIRGSLENVDHSRERNVTVYLKADTMAVKEVMRAAIASYDKGV